ncbi:MAG: hypothetical protein ACI965_000656 [Paraglaciecola sp.]
MSLNVCIALAHFTVLEEDSADKTYIAVAKLYAEGDVDAAMEDARRATWPRG